MLLFVGDDRNRLAESPQSDSELVPDLQIRHHGSRIRETHEGIGTKWKVDVQRLTRSEPRQYQSPVKGYRAAAAPPQPCQACNQISERDWNRICESDGTATGMFCSDECRYGCDEVIFV